MANSLKNDPLTIYTVTYVEKQPGMLYRQEPCPPHEWYYADMISHWRCSACGKLRHKRPKALDRYEVRRVEIPYKEVQRG